MAMQNHEKAKEYQRRVGQVSPTHNTYVNCFRAFLVGGIICTIGQLLIDIFTNSGMEAGEAQMIASIVLIFVGALLTGLDVYDAIAKFAGAGTVIPITGFANSMVSPAMEYKKEGYVFGVGAKMFSMAGPVIVYGVISSVVVGILYLFIFMR